jgi:acyl-CoA synthetase (AMP-forming)/AMP-acid ligase II
MPSLPALIERACLLFDDAIAASDDHKAITFAALGERSARLANGLRAIAGDSARVGLLMSNRVEFVEADVAIVRAGLTKLPLNPRLAAPEHRYMLEDAGVSVLLVDPDHADFGAEMRDALADLQTVLVLGESGTYEAFLAEGSARSPGVRPGAGAPSSILYTSGTTGRPKGAVLSYSGRLASMVAMLTDELDIRAGDVMAHVAPLSHGSGSKILTYLVRGAENRSFDRFDEERFLRLAADGEITSSFMVPTMIQRLIDAHRGEDVSALRHITYGGAPMAAARIRMAMDLFGAIFVQVYGSCEAPHPVTLLPAALHARFRDDDHVLGSAGYEATMAEVRFVDRHGVEVPDGEKGEMIVRTPNLMSGYWGNPEATAQVLTDGSYRTGDIGYRDDRGFLTIVDRERDMIISGGLNVYPAEVEATILTHPDVIDVAVVGAPDESWGEIVKAFVVARPGSALTGDDVVAHCRANLAGYKKPRQVELVASLPKGSTGKILKRELRDAAWAGRKRQVN